MLSYSTWEWLAPTVLLTVWLLVPVITVELFLSGIHNEVKDNVLRSKTTMKRLRSNIRIARELNESDEEDVDVDIEEDRRDENLEMNNEQSMLDVSSSPSAPLQRNHFPLDPRLNPSEHLFMRGMTDLIICKRVSKENKKSLFVSYIRMKKGMEALVFLYEAFNLWSCMFVGSIEWSKLAPTAVFLYGSGKSLDMYKGYGERAGFYAILALFLVAAVCMLTKDATVGPRAMQKHNIALRHRLSTSSSWKEFFLGKEGKKKKRKTFSAREWRFHLTVFFQYFFFEFLFMPGLSISLVILNCYADRSDPNNPHSKRIYLFRPMGGKQECWQDGHGIDSFIGVFMAIVIYTCAIYHKRQKMRQASTTVLNLFFEIFYSMIKAALTVIAVCFPEAQSGKLLMYACVASFGLLALVNYKTQPCKGYGTVINSYRAATFAIGVVTSLLAVLVNEVFESTETKNIAAAIWIAMLFPVAGFAYEYNMLCASLLSGDVPEDKTISDLLKTHKDAKGNTNVGGLNVQRIAGNCVARLLHINANSSDVILLAQQVLWQSTQNRQSLSNLHHGLSGIFGFFSPNSIQSSILLVKSGSTSDDERTRMQGDSSRSARRRITQSMGRVLADHVVQNPYLHNIVVNSQRFLMPIPVKAIKQGELRHLELFEISLGEAEILKGLFKYVLREFGPRALPDTIELGCSEVRARRMLMSLPRGEERLEKLERGEVSRRLVLNVRSIMDNSCDYALDLSNHFLTTADMLLVMYFLKQNDSIYTLNFSANCLDAGSLLMLAEKFSDPDQECRVRELDLSDNFICQESKYDYDSGSEEMQGNVDNLYELGVTLRDSKYLRRLKVEYGQTIDLTEAPRLVQLDLEGSLDLRSRIGDDTTIMLTALLPRFPNLYELNLSKNNITNKGCSYLATRALFPDFVDNQWQNSRVVTLNLSENKIGDEGLVSLATMLKKNEHLSKLDLSRNSFSPIGLSFLSKGLVKTKFSHLKELYLEDNDLPSGATDPLLEVLSRKETDGSDCTTLKTLSLSGIKLYSAGAVKVAMMLRANQTLENLFLSNCELDQECPKTKPKFTLPGQQKKYRDDTGLIELSKSLAINQGLKIIDLSSNSLVTQEFIAIVLYLKANPNTTLEHLKVHDNNIGISMAQFRPLIIEEVLTNPALKKIDLYSNPCEMGVTRELQVLMSRKNTNANVLRFG